MKYAATICNYNGKKVLTSQLAVAEYYCAIAVQRIAYSISQNFPVTFKIIAQFFDVHCFW